MADAAAVADYLGLSPVFAPLSPAERHELALRMRPRHFGRNEVIFHRDDPGGHVFLIASGTVKISVEEESGQEVVVALARGGDVFGELALFDEGPRSATVTALTETIAYALAKSDFTNVVERNPAAMRQLLATLARRIRRSTGHIEDLVFLDLPGRVAKFLVDQNEIASSTGSVRLTQEDVAAFVGATRVATNRVLVDLERRGLVKLGRGHIDIVDADGLKREIRH
jgi:CRP/FNR family transcriptional regulator